MNLKYKGTNSKIVKMTISMYFQYSKVIISILTCIMSYGLHFVGIFLIMICIVIYIGYILYIFGIFLFRVPCECENILVQSCKQLNIHYNFDITQKNWKFYVPLWLTRKSITKSDYRLSTLCFGYKAEYQSPAKKQFNSHNCVSFSYMACYTKLTYFSWHWRIGFITIV